MKKVRQKAINVPLNSKLPGRYGRMTAAQLDAISDAYDQPNSGASSRDPTKAELAKLQRARHVGRPRMPADEKAVKVNVSFRPKLLRETDIYAKQIGTTRAGLIDSALNAMLKSARRSA